MDTLNKSDFERVFKIAQWNPTADQLLSLNEEFNRRLNNDIALDGMIQQFIPDCTFIANEGIDNSDIKIILSLMAKK